MMDKSLLQNQITGLEVRLKELHAQRDLFTRAAGLDESIASTQRDREQAERSLAGAKERLAKLQEEKAKSLSATTEALAAKMSEILPEGTAIFRIDEDGLFIGWEKSDGKVVPYAGLSGGQRVPFDQALCNALLGDGEKIIILEASELDVEHLSALLDRLTKTDEKTQIILNTWLSPPQNIPEAWKIVRVE